MDLTLSDEQQLIAESAEAFLAEASAMPAVRATSEQGDGFDRGLWRGLAELGWCGVHLPETVGGLGLGVVELALLQEQLGRRLACVPFFDSVALAASLLRELPDFAAARDLLPRLASGEAIAALAPPWDCAATTARATPCGAGWTLDGAWPRVASAPVADVLLLPAFTAAGEPLLFQVAADALGLLVQPLTAIDATRRSADLRAVATPLPASACLARGEALAQAWARARCLAAIALAAEQVGVAQACLDLTLDYTAQRHQFERPIASFQAVKHRCAQMLVALEGARSAVYGAACVADTAPDAATLLFHAAQARIEATDAAQFCAREAIQLHGGMGFTWEFDLHRYLRRAQLGSQRLGPLAWWREQVAAQLLDDPAPTPEPTA
ncbi:MAG TPA: acyl-CoA dehydrogenase family protein [Ramlibacter sp.]|nr:acyl-CoA dehydrogenase family protein [Ramlibacter sp.]